MPKSESNITLDQQDEIALSELWQIVVDNRKIVFASLATAVALGLLLILLRPATYTVTSIIEIGHLIEGSKRTPLESPDSVKAKLEIALAPSLLPETSTPPNLSNLLVKVHEKSNLLTISNSVKTDELETAKSLQNRLIGKLIEDHQQRLNLHRRDIDSQIAVAKVEMQRIQDERFNKPKIRGLQAQAQSAKAALRLLTDPLLVSQKMDDLKLKLNDKKRALGALKDKETLNTKKTKNLNQAKKLLGEQVIELRKLLTSGELSQIESNIQPGNSEALSLLILNSDQQKARLHLNELETRLYVELENESADIEQQEKENRRLQHHQTDVIAQLEKGIETFKIENLLAQQTQQAKIAMIESKIEELEALQEQEVALKNLEIDKLVKQRDSLIGTKTVTPPQRSPLPTGSPKTTILFLFIVSGLVVGLFGVFAKLRLQKKLSPTLRSD